MRNLIGLKGLLTLGLLQAVLAPCARAEFMVTVPTQSIPTTKTDWGPGTASLIALDPFQIPKLDPSVYQPLAPPGKTVSFDAMSITLKYEFDNSVMLRFDNVSTITVNLNGNMHLTLPDGVTDLTGTPTFGTSVTRSSTSADMFSKFVTVNPNPVIGTAAMGYLASTRPDILASFTGTGTINLPVTAHGQSSFSSSSGNGQAIVITQASASISVVYYYSFVPEPSSLALTGLGGAGLLVAGRKRLRRKD